LSSSHLLPNPPLPIRDRLEPDAAPALPHHFDAARVQPAAQILALADVEELQVPTALDDGFNARARDAHAAAHAEIAQLEQVQRYAAQGRVRDGGAAEGEVEVG
jgi:hypothetical protein